MLGGLDHDQGVQRRQEAGWTRTDAVTWGTNLLEKNIVRENVQRALEAQVVEELRRQNEELRQQAALLQSAASIKNEAVKKAADATSEIS